MGDNLPILNFGDNFIVKDLIQGSFGVHGCVISTNNDVKCWGNANKGEYVNNIFIQCIS